MTKYVEEPRKSTKQRQIVWKKVSRNAGIALLFLAGCALIAYDVFQPEVDVDNPAEKETDSALKQLQPWDTFLNSRREVPFEITFEYLVIAWGLLCIGQILLWRWEAGREEASRGRIMPRQVDFSSPFDGEDDGRAYLPFYSRVVMDKFRSRLPVGGEQLLWCDRPVVTRAIGLATIKALLINILFGPVISLYWLVVRQDGARLPNYFNILMVLVVTLTTTFYYRHLRGLQRTVYAVTDDGVHWVSEGWLGKRKKTLRWEKLAPMKLHVVGGHNTKHLQIGSVVFVPSKLGNTLSHFNPVGGFLNIRYANKIAATINERYDNADIPDERRSAVPMVKVAVKEPKQPKPKKEKKVKEPKPKKEKAKKPSPKRRRKSSSPTPDEPAPSALEQAGSSIRRDSSSSDGGGSSSRRSVPDDSMRSAVSEDNSEDGSGRDSMRSGGSEDDSGRDSLRSIVSEGEFDVDKVNFDQPSGDISDSD